jgi:NADPH:quinone reductase-like Zn-dependent oxidoreductase
VQAVVINDGALVVEERPDPVPGDHEVLVAVRAAGVNAADLVQRLGLYPAPPGSPPDIPGMELAGEVVGLGRGVTGARLGDRVMAVVGGGAQAERATVDEEHLLAVPDDLGWPEAGGFPEVFSTAHDALITRAGLRPGERLLVTGAAGGVGSAAVQLGAAAGATVVASVRNPERHHEVAALGAATVIEPAAVGDHGPYDVVLELVSGPGMADSLAALDTGGRAVVIGVGAGAQVEVDLFCLMRRRARLEGATLRARGRAEKAAVAAALRRQVLPLLAAGRLRVPVCDTFPLTGAPAAYERFSRGDKLGKVVLLAGE